LASPHKSQDIVPTQPVTFPLNIPVYAPFTFMLKFHVLLQQC